MDEGEEGRRVGDQRYERKIKNDKKNFSITPQIISYKFDTFSNKSGWGGRRETSGGPTLWTEIKNKKLFYKDKSPMK